MLDFTLPLQRNKPGKPLFSYIGSATGKEAFSLIFTSVLRGLGRDALVFKEKKSTQAELTSASLNIHFVNLQNVGFKSFNFPLIEHTL